MLIWDVFGLWINLLSYSEYYNIDLDLKMAIIAFIFLLLIPPVSIFVKIRKIKKQKREKQELLIKHNAVDCAKMYHLSGLPLVVNDNCILFLNLNKHYLEIMGSGAQFILELNKILEIEVRTKTEDNNPYKGYVNSRMYGSVESGKIKVKSYERPAFLNKKNTTAQCLVITYQKNSSVNFLMFKIGPYVPKKTKKFLALLQENISQQNVTYNL